MTGDQRTRRKEPTIEHVDYHGLRVGVGGVAGVLPGVGLLGPLDEQVRRGDVTLLRDDGHAASRGVVVDFLRDKK